MLFLLIAAAFWLVAPTWILCAIGLGDYEDEAALQWITRGLGVGAVVLSLWLMFR